MVFSLCVLCVFLGVSARDGRLFFLKISPKAFRNTPKFHAIVFGGVDFFSKWSKIKEIRPQFFAEFLF